MKKTSLIKTLGVSAMFVVSASLVGCASTDGAEKADEAAAEEAPMEEAAAEEAPAAEEGAGEAAAEEGEAGAEGSCGGDKGEKGAEGSCGEGSCG